MKHLIMFPDGPWVLLDEQMNAIGSGEDYMLDDPMDKHPDAIPGAVVGGLAAMQVLSSESNGGRAHLKRRIQ